MFCFVLKHNRHCVRNWLAGVRFPILLFSDFNGKIKKKSKDLPFAIIKQHTTTEPISKRLIKLRFNFKFSRPFQIKINRSLWPKCKYIYDNKNLQKQKRQSLVNLIKYAFALFYKCSRSQTKKSTKKTILWKDYEEEGKKNIYLL